MTVENQCLLSSYRPIASLSEDKKVDLVQQIYSRKLYVRKQLRVYDASVFRCLMEHPAANMPRIEALVEEDGVLTVIEEYLCGETLRERLDRCGQLAEKDAAFLMLQLCTIVQSLHNAHPTIVHRDIKPENIMISPDGVVKLFDIDAAKRVTPGKSQDTCLIGTAGYAAPEQYGFQPSGPAADIYAMGVVFNELLTGKLPREQLAGGRFSKLIASCIRLDPSERCPSAAELHRSLSVALKMRPSVEDEDWTQYLPPGYRSQRPLRMVISTILYGLLFDMCLTLNVKNVDSGYALGVYRFFLSLSVLLMILFSGNYRGIHDRIPVLRSSPLPLRVLLIILGDIFLFFLAVIFIALLT